MNPERYIRQIRLKEFGPQAQEKLSNAKILVVGAGGLGIPALQYLNAMGAGTLGIAEQDAIEATNLHRQVLYNESEVGRPKIEVISQRLREQNTETNLILHDTFLVRDNALEIIEAYDLVIDATDNFGSRYLINDACVILDKPMVYGALHGFEGQLSVFNYNGSATYRCLFPSMPGPDEIPDCNLHGVLGVIPGIIGNLQALEAVKIITGVGEVNSNKMLIYNGLNNSIYTINILLKPENLHISELSDHYAMGVCDPTQEITIDELLEILEKDQEIQLIDVRSKGEYENGALAGSLNIPLGELETRHTEIIATIPVYLICQSGVRSLSAMQILTELNIENKLFHIKGGIDQYEIHSSRDF